MGLSITLLSTQGQAQEKGSSVSGKIQSIDADSFYLKPSKESQLEIRLQGIDALEKGQLCIKGDLPWDCAEDSITAFKAYVQGKTFRCNLHQKDRYGRWVSTCFNKDQNLNAWLVKQGWALAYRRYSQAYVLAEYEAKLKRKGLWKGEFMRPEQWRKEKRLAKSRASETTKDLSSSKQEEQGVNRPSSASTASTSLSKSPPFTNSSSAFSSGQKLWFLSLAGAGAFLLFLFNPVAQQRSFKRRLLFRLSFLGTALLLSYSFLIVFL